MSNFKSDFYILPRLYYKHEEEKESGKYIRFRPISSTSLEPRRVCPGLGYKMSGDIKLIRLILESNGMSPHKSNWRVLWHNSSARSNLFSSLERWQKINHFPRSHEITKKDSLFKNIAKMQSLHGMKNFDFIPETYALPGDLSKLLDKMQEDTLWIVKPAGKSQGRGIYLTRNPDELPQSGSYVVCRYIDNPLLINGLKFDLRIYVAVTSIHPLRIYIYREGLVRFATEQYNSQENNRFVHLTNYSINKFSSKFEAGDEEHLGHKWTLTALKEYLNEIRIDFAGIWSSIRDIVVKTIISIEAKMLSAFNMYVPYRNNCFELLGFDILVDDMLNPWLLEVNLSPSLNIDSPLDLKVKSALISDLLNLAGIFKSSKKKESVKPTAKPAWNSSTLLGEEEGELTSTEKNILRETQDEIHRMGNFERVFPSEFSFMYRHLFEGDRPLNYLVSGEINKIKKHVTRSTIPSIMGNAYKQSLLPFEKKRKKTKFAHRKEI